MNASPQTDWDKKKEGIFKMKQFALLLLRTQLLYVWAVSEPIYPLNPGSCECPDAVAAADLALRKINSHRKQGYIFSYHRLSNVNQKQKVYGQCQATIYINKVERAIRLYNYNCSLRPVPRNRVHDICLNCPEARKVDDPAVLNATQLVLQKYNNESPHLKYFALLNVTKASEQHKGHCKGSYMKAPDNEYITVSCELFEPEV
ncbi:UNVERIFIED_CONTAM: hypothetical protein FKN15_071547 [Acipenser sinensis]